MTPPAEKTHGTDFTRQNTRDGKPVVHENIISNLDAHPITNRQISESDIRTGIVLPRNPI